MLDTPAIKQRWTHAWEAKQDELDRIQKAYLWLYEFEKHLKEGESGDSAYRFPETMGYVMRRYNEYLQVLPEAKVRGVGDGAIGLQGAIDHQKIVSNLDAVKMGVMANATAFGNECLFVAPHIWRRKDKSGKEWVQYSGLAAEQVDWRHFFPAPGYKKVQDHTGKNGLPHTFRRRIYHYDTFKAIGEAKGWKNMEKVQATTWENANVWGADVWPTIHESTEMTSAKEYVTLIEYWDIIADELRYYATGGIELYESKEGIPYKHKQLPFHHLVNN